jgi:hypothetical protein
LAISAVAINGAGSAHGADTDVSYANFAFASELGQDVEPTLWWT